MTQALPVLHHSVHAIQAGPAQSVRIIENGDLCVAGSCKIHFFKLYTLFPP